MQEEIDAARARIAMQRACGLDEVELIEGNDLVRRFPWVDPHAVLGATWCPSDGFLHPAVVYNEALAAAQRLGARLVQNAPVLSADHAGERLTTVITPKGRFEADLFVDATNAWSPRLGRLLGGVDLPVAPLKRYLWFAERAGSLDAHTLAVMPLVVTPSGAYCRPENAGSLLIGWAHDARPEPDFDWADQDNIEPRFFHRSGPDSMAFEAWAAIAEVLPGVGEFAGITATTSGYYATTPDHNPFLDYDPAVPNLIRLVGFSGHGAMFGPFTALVAGELAEAGRYVSNVSALGRAVDLGAFRIGRRYAHAERLVI
jgi:glycine/D-amino acid oxidase-like deaminating enzyme